MPRDANADFAPRTIRESWSNVLVRASSRLVHDRLFAEPTALAVADLVRHVQAIGLDVPQFEQCLGRGSHAAAVRRDLVEGQKAGVRGTPTFFLGLTEPGRPELKATRLLVGAQPYASFREAIEALLAEPR